LKRESFFSALLFLARARFLDAKAFPPAHQFPPRRSCPIVENISRASSVSGFKAQPAWRVAAPFFLKSPHPISEIQGLPFFPFGDFSSLVRRHSTFRAALANVFFWTSTFMLFSLTPFPLTLSIVRVISSSLFPCVRGYFLLVVFRPFWNVIFFFSPRSLVVVPFFPRLPFSAGGPLPHQGFSSFPRAVFFTVPVHRLLALAFFFFPFRRDFAAVFRELFA